MRRLFFITGTNTGVGKTVFTVSLTRNLRAQGINAVALKPICSGGRSDARKIYRANNEALTLDEINPWHFKAAIAPTLAARQEGKKVKMGQLTAHLRAMQKRFDVLLIEGAGGLLSPMGDGFNSRDLILELQAQPIIVAPNRLGVINHVLLTLEALPPKFRARATVMLATFGRADASTKSNSDLLAGYFDAKRIFTTGVSDLAGKLLERV